MNHPPMQSLREKKYLRIARKAGKANVVNFNPYVIEDVNIRQGLKERIVQESIQLQINQLAIKQLMEGQNVEGHIIIDKTDAKAGTIIKTTPQKANAKEEFSNMQDEDDKKMNDENE